jgi:hypothetical protein
MYEIFAAQDDAAALAMLEDRWKPPIYRDEGLQPQTLADLEALLTGRTSQEVASDPRHGQQIAELFDEDVGVAEAGLVTITDTLTHALAAADAATLAAAGTTWRNGDAAVQGLATVARHATAHGHRMYCFWYF